MNLEIPSGIKRSFKEAKKKDNEDGNIENSFFLIKIIIII